MLTTDSRMPELSDPLNKSRNFCLPIQRQFSQTTIRFARFATYAVFFGDGLGFGVWAGHIPIFKQKFHLGDAQLSVALFALALGAICAMPIVGQRLTRFGSRALTGFFASLYGIVIACLALAPSYPLFVLGAALLGACTQRSYSHPLRRSGVRRSRVRFAHRFSIPPGATF